MARDTHPYSLQVPLRTRAQVAGLSMTFGSAETAGSTGGPGALAETAMSASYSGHERVTVVGAGMAGLSLALALGQSGRYRIVLLDKDAQPGDFPAEQAFSDWHRKGVAHFRQAHFFHPRLRAILRSRFPSLYQDILRAGVRELTIRDALPPDLARRYTPTGEDDESTLLLSRRATLEAVLRRTVARLSTVEIAPATTVRGVIVSHLTKAKPQVIGVRAESIDGTSEIFSDLVVDASGRTTKFDAWLRDVNVAPAEEEDVRIDLIYYTRHFRCDGQAAEGCVYIRPLAGRHGPVGYSICPGDNTTFSVSLIARNGDSALRRMIANAEGFQAVCAGIPKVAPWVEPLRAEPISDVLAMGGFRNHWRTYVGDSGPRVYGYFAIGDAMAQSNPAYGAGCSWAMQEACMLADVLEETTDPAERAVVFDRRVRETARPYFHKMRRKDRRSGYLTEVGTKRSSSSIGQRVKKIRFLIDGMLEIAMAEDVKLARWCVQRRYMIRPPTDRYEMWIFVAYLSRFWSAFLIKYGVINGLSRVCRELALRGNAP